MLRTPAHAVTENASSPASRARRDLDCRAGHDPYDTFCAEVARRQFGTWLDRAHREAPPGPIVTVSGSALVPSLVRERTDRACVHVGDRSRPAPPGAIPVRADHDLLACLRTESVGALVADDGAWVDALALEESLRAAYRVLLPGGQLIVRVESALSGMASLAAAGRWAELADAPRADVVLVPATGSAKESYLRCFTAGQLRESLAEIGFVVRWVRPRTVLSRDVVDRSIRLHGQVPAALIETELRLAADYDGQDAGRWLVAAAERPRPGAEAAR